MRFYCLLLLVLGWLPVSAGEDRPNIVYILADDHSWTDFGFMGNDRVHTPNLDLFAEKSKRFPNGYLNCSVCRPSLVTLLTGQYQHVHGIHFNHGPPGNDGYNRMKSADEYVQVRAREFELIKKVPTLPRILSRECGYRCLQTGKFWEGHWENGGFTEGMTVFEAPPADQTFGGIRKLANGDRVAHGNGDLGLQIGRVTMQPIEEFILDCEKEHSPWLVWYAPYLPHQPHDSPERFYKIARNTPGVKAHEIPYFASIAQFDDTVGQLIRFVEKNSDVENTIFVFVSDNGWSPSTKRQKNRTVEFAHTKNSKRAPFDEGIRSPVLIRWDGRIEPETCSELVSSIDIVPTLLQAAGAPAPELPGMNLLESIPGDRAVFGAIYPGDASSLSNPGKDVAYRWVRRGGYKLIVPKGANPWGRYLKTSALYDVENDPAEETDLYNDPALASVRASLHALLDNWYNP